LEPEPPWVGLYINATCYFSGQPNGQLSSMGE